MLTYLLGDVLRIFAGDIKSRELARVIQATTPKFGRFRL